MLLAVMFLATAMVVADLEEVTVLEDAARLPDGVRPMNAPQWRTFNDIPGGKTGLEEKADSHNWPASMPQIVRCLPYLSILLSLI